MLLLKIVGLALCISLLTRSRWNLQAVCPHCQSDCLTDQIASLQAAGTMYEPILMSIQFTRQVLMSKVFVTGIILLADIVSIWLHTSPTASPGWYFGISSHESMTQLSHRYTKSHHLALVAGSLPFDPRLCTTIFSCMLCNEGVQ